VKITSIAAEGYVSADCGLGPMQFCRNIAQLTLLGVLTYGSNVAAQQRNIASSPASAPSCAQGQLTVTLTVVASAGIVFDSNGEPKLMVANAASPADNVSWLQTVPHVIDTTLQPRAKSSAKKK
jgi:hypothetical protein